MTRQHSKHLSCDGLLHYKYVIQFAVERIVKIGEHLAKLQAIRLIVSYNPFTLDVCPQRFRTHQISKITCVQRTETDANRCYVNRQINVSLLSINKYQIAVDQFWLRPTDWQTDAISDWPTADHVRQFSTTAFLFLWQLCTVDNGIFLYGWCKQLFVSELNNAYFSAVYFKTVFEWLSLA